VTELEFRLLGPLEVMAAAGLASALLSLTLGRARGGRQVTRDLAATGAPT
jgi:hypothetical protein